MLFSSVEDRQFMVDCAGQTVLVDINSLGDTYMLRVEGHKLWF